MTKYKAAAEIANAALAKVIEACVDGASIVKVCQLGDDFIVAETGKMWKKNKDLVKGIGFPTCVTVNNLVGHFTPLSDNTATLKKGDIVKIDLGVQFDGYVALAAHTIAVGTDAVTGVPADVVLAAYNAAQLAARLLKAGSTNDVITQAIADVCSDYKVNPVLGVLSHNMEQYRIDGDHVIANKENMEHRTPKATFEANQVFAVDVVVSSGEGKPKASDERTTVFKRDPSINISLKVSSSRQLVSEVDQKYPCFPFTARALDEKVVKMGSVECVRANILEPYPVLAEKAGSIVAQFKFTALLMPTGTQVICGLPPVSDVFKSDKAVTKAEYVEALKAPISDKKVKKAAKPE